MNNSKEPRILVHGNCTPRPGRICVTPPAERCLKYPTPTHQNMRFTTNQNQHDKWNIHEHEALSFSAAKLKEKKGNQLPRKRSTPHHHAHPHTQPTPNNYSATHANNPKERTRMQEFKTRLIGSMQIKNGYKKSQ
ncbi:hypothetical protein K440DRAFT_227235 [Wilcoxina mikolae CBS 423.85]|nr:hypothetical protein K440DRAFT_227235 [Wilcoxina mikolae CBS 423.85]